jgi:hypothetical protein
MVASHLAGSSASLLLWYQSIHCQLLIHDMSVHLHTIAIAMSKRMQVGTLQQFAQQYNIHVTRGIRRFEKGVPATVEMPTVSNQAPVIIQVTQDILEFKDMLFMKWTEVEQVCTRLSCFVSR